MLQPELAYAFRLSGWTVRFEVPLRADRLSGPTLPPKFNFDLLLSQDDVSVGVELKVPLKGRHPETMYDFCADIEFVKAIKRVGHISVGFCRW